MDNKNNQSSGEAEKLELVKFSLPAHMVDKLKKKAKK